MLPDTALHMMCCVLSAYVVAAGCIGACGCLFTLLGALLYIHAAIRAGICIGALSALSGCFCYLPYELRYCILKLLLFLRLLLASLAALSLHTAFCYLLLIWVESYRFIAVVTLLVAFAVDATAANNYHGRRSGFC